MTDKTHYRKAFDSPYLASADIVEPTVLTIKCVRLEKDRTKKTKDLFNTAYFAEKEIRQGEPLKPMILNATNSKTMRQLTGSAFIDDWNDVRVTVYVDSQVKFGTANVEGLRISTEAPAEGMGGAGLRGHWLAKAKNAASLGEMSKVSKDGAHAFNTARDREGYQQFAKAVQARGAELRKQAEQPAAEAAHG
ncbi:hypothetical protein GCM10028796_17530 [Ramlibacter monticola]|uniref:Uncharacterized protein n=1 Tax=Ramlibacter monticola TaxID=1926872 RepID=A0A936YVR6_9BURK|nr:hypothetical protein [Ramlibacter monticola]MBL0390578.1 hypothetical protein [Ramlibacter monticola]